MFERCLHCGKKTGDIQREIFGLFCSNNCQSKMKEITKKDDKCIWCGGKGYLDENGKQWQCCINCNNAVYDYFNPIRDNVRKEIIKLEKEFKKLGINPKKYKNGK